MDDTVKLRSRRHLITSPSTRPASAPSTPPPRWGCPGAPVWTCLFPGNSPLPLAFPGRASRPPRSRAFPPVAYFFRAQSRLGYSPNGAFDRAYHTTTGKGGGKTNNGLDKKSGPSPAARPAAASAVAQRQRRSTPVRQGWSNICLENSRHHVFYNLVNPKED